MRVSRTFQAAALAGVLSVCWLSNCFASVTSVDPKHSFETMQKDASLRQSDFEVWQIQEKQEVLLVIAIGSLGIIIGACQSASNRWIRGLTVLLGTSVSIITLSMNTYYPADYQTLRRAVFNAKPKILGMNHQLDLYSPDMEPRDFQALQTEFYASISDFDQISDSILGTSADTRAKAKNSAQLSRKLPGLFLTTVFAQSNPSNPAWTSSNEVSDPDGTIFVGIGRNTSLELAKNASLDDAFVKAVKHYQADHPEASAPFYVPQITSITKQLGDIRDTWTTLDASRVYVYYTKLFVPSKINLISLISPQASLDGNLLDPEPWDAKAVHDTLGVHIKDHYYCYRFTIHNSTGHEITLLSAEVKFADRTLPGDTRTEVYSDAARLATKAHKKTIDSLIVNDFRKVANLSTQTRAVFIKKSAFSSLAEAVKIQAIRVKYNNANGQQSQIEIRPAPNR